MNKWVKMALAMCVVFCMAAGFFSGLAAESKSYKQVDENQHEVTEEYKTGEVTESGREKTGTKTYNESHSFDESGKCVLCGYTRSTSDDDIKPGDDTDIEPEEEQPGEETEPTEEEGGSAALIIIDDFDDEEEETAEVAAVEEAFGVKLSDNLTMVDSLIAIGNYLDAESATVSVPAIESVLTSAQKTSFDALSSREKLLVASAIYGFADEVKANGDLSADALALIDDVMGSLSPAELKAIAADAMGTVVENGVEYDAFTFEFIANENGASTTVRQTYRYDNNAWILTKIEKG